MCQPIQFHPNCASSREVVHPKDSSLFLLLLMTLKTFMASMLTPSFSNLNLFDVTERDKTQQNNTQVLTSFLQISSNISTRCICTISVIAVSQNSHVLILLHKKRWVYGTSPHHFWLPHLGHESVPRLRASADRRWPAAAPHLNTSPLFTPNERNIFTRKQ